jgi:hypothetical protein
MLFSETRINELGTTLAVTSNKITVQRNTILTYIVFLCCAFWLLVTANAPSSLILVTPMMEAVRSSKTSVLTRPTQHNIPEDGIPHSHCHENPKSYNFSFFHGNYLQTFECFFNKYGAPSVTRDGLTWTSLFLKKNNTFLRRIDGNTALTR